MGAEGHHRVDDSAPRILEYRNFAKAKVTVHIVVPSASFFCVAAESPLVLDLNLC